MHLHLETCAGFHGGDRQWRPAAGALSARPITLRVCVFLQNPTAVLRGWDRFRPGRIHSSLFWPVFCGRCANGRVVRRAHRRAPMGPGGGRVRRLVPHPLAGPVNVQGRYQLDRSNCGEGTHRRHARPHDPRRARARSENSVAHWPVASVAAAPPVRAAAAPAPRVLARAEPCRTYPLQHSRNSARMTR